MVFQDALSWDLRAGMRLVLYYETSNFLGSSLLDDELRNQSLSISRITYSAYWMGVNEREES